MIGTDVLGQNTRKSVKSFQSRHTASIGRIDSRMCPFRFGMPGGYFRLQRFTSSSSNHQNPFGLFFGETARKRGLLQSCTLGTSLPPNSFMPSFKSVELTMACAAVWHAA